MATAARYWKTDASKRITVICSVVVLTRSLETVTAADGRLLLFGLREEAACLSAARLRCNKSCAAAAAGRSRRHLSPKQRCNVLLQLPSAPLQRREKHGVHVIVVYFERLPAVQHVR